MTTENPGRKSRTLETELVPVEQQCMQPDQDYRLLQHSYRQSAEYAAMVQRYPLLRSWITACESSDLVGHPPAITGEKQPG
ncbi:MAG: hypothetical protein WD136_04360 [Cyanobium sp.]